MTLKIGFADGTLSDGEKLFFGDDADYSIYYDDTADEWRFRDEGANADVLTVSGQTVAFGGDLTDGSNIIYDSSNGWVPQGRLENDSITVTAGDGISGGGAIALGGSATFDVAVADFAGEHLGEIGGDLAVVDDSITVTAGDGISGGGSVELGLSTTLSVAVADFAGEHLSDDGSGNLAVDDDFVLNSGDEITGTLTASGTPAITLGGDLTDGTVTIFDSTNDWVPTSVLEANTVSVAAGDGISGGGSVSLGGSTTLDVAVADFSGTFLSDDGSNNLTVDIGSGLENDGSGAIRVTDDHVQDGDGIDRDIWIIDNGASDPAGADSNDIIFERES